MIIEYQLWPSTVGLVLLIGDDSRKTAKRILTGSEAAVEKADIEW
jgi:hypothetical protein